MTDEIYSVETASQEPPHPWGVREVIWGSIATFLLAAVLLIATQFLDFGSSALMIVFELIFAIPALVLLWRKKVSWHSLGLRPFPFADLLIGVAIMFAVYLVILLHNMTLAFFDIMPQGEYMLALFETDLNLWLLGSVIVLIAPITEELFFRSFVYSGLAENLGWKKAALISALFFGAAHMQLVSFIPTFLLGLVFAYLYHRSKSVFPGMLLHFLVNGFSFTMIALITQFADQLPF